MNAVAFPHVPVDIKHGNDITNGSDVDYAQHCPVHNTPAKKEYEFGRPYAEAFVTTYKGCECACCTQMASLRKLYFTSYQGAESHARYTVQRIRARY